MQMMINLFCVNNFRKNQRNYIKIFSRKCNSVIKDGKLSRNESWTNKYTIKQIKICNKNKKGKLLRLNKEIFEDEELPNELFLTTRQTNKIRNAFASNMSIDIKHSKAQISKIVQSGGSFGCWLGNLVKKKTLKNIAISLARDNLPGLLSNLTSSSIYKFDIKINEKEAVRAENEFTFLFRMKIWITLLNS